ncbi:SRPBCC family protein [Mycolicibacterium hodleri]
MSYVSLVAVNESREITIEATPEEILEVLLDIETLPEWSPAHQEVEVLERDADGRPSRTRQVVKIVGVSDEQELAHVVHPDGVGWSLISAQQQRAQEARYTLTPVGDSTHVRFDITVDPIVPLPSFLIKRGAKGLLETATDGLRARVLKVKRG